jgi:ribosome-associated heat shock protein Hsp15
MSDNENVRIDKWLWAARFFKTRSMASKAVSGGHVHVNDGRVKPSRLVNIGDVLRIQRGETEFTVQVLQISDRRGPAVVARTLYEESEESIRARQKQSELRRLQAAEKMYGPVKRPNKRQRREIVRFTRKK